MKKLDEKFSVDGDTIIKTSNGEQIPDDEPVFLLRGRDRLALRALICYEQLSMAAGCNEYHFDALHRSIDRFADFTVEHPDRMKQPSMTRGL